jgi:aryl-alcohol dehydrogenase-like predicted oxidoreductase
MLSGKYLDESTTGARYSASDPQGRRAKLPTETLLAFRALAEGIGHTMTEVSLAWVAAQPGITSPIIGARSIAQLQQSAGALELKLEPETLTAIDGLFAPGTHSVEYYNANFGPGKKPR